VQCEPAGYFVSPLLASNHSSISHLPDKKEKIVFQKQERYKTCIFSKNQIEVHMMLSGTAPGQEMNCSYESITEPMK